MADKVTIEAIRRTLYDALQLDPQLEIPDDMPLAGGEHDLDSLDLLLLITTLEKEFGIKIPEESLDREVFATVSTLADFVEAHGAK